jgi:hypothetical protein
MMGALGRMLGRVPYVLGRMPCGKDPFKSPFSSNKGIKKDNGGRRGTRKDSIKVLKNTSKSI